MKNLKLIVVLLMTISLVSFTSCNSDDNSEENNPSGEHLTAKIDGTAWAASENYDTTVATINSNVFVLQGSDEVGNAIRINLYNYTGAATYYTGDNLSNTSSISYVSISPVASWMSTFNIGSGTIHITKEDGSIAEGTFSFEGYNGEAMTTKIITEGSFKANIE
jgi:hypothetical protein